ncbi:16S rRNA (cytosine(1402)-N(4))-methyltransferase RsmH [Alkaliphilus sp. MSJ-5]|uniref:Ribosomal RNA small subunit methyltransferase H n=1 Tax=Alkaliphilus flagellatus TaxID=2841507 RepID=A0ABS6G470_9FIRM|nr:16S rRNA (cytosine(1402)-N(4))-methyltransferase RsmH [Alkaliphilus flagellatus]MBU5677288.1 16S rRNA (cytosine(1402)-N(4))-methyltransferase RsmH [Alkaliphilus flagellatus]
MEFKHISVLLEECIENLNIKENGIYVDGTLGGAGHSKEIAKRLGQNGLLIGIDQDENAIKAASEKLSNMMDRVKLVRDNFSNLSYVLESLGILGFDGLLLDLGVSSHQLDEAERGFSYMNDAPLDMRMDNRNILTAKDIVNNYSEQDLEDIIKSYGEEKWAKRIAQFIVKFRNDEEIVTTHQLVDIIKRAIPKGARIDGPHPAKRTFQAIRIEVNGELDIIKNTIEAAVEKLNKGGRICIITFHSLEDRIVKNAFRALSNPCTCPTEFPICQCNKKPTVKIITRKPILPTDEELEVNPRSRSAKLRVIEKI